MQASARRLRAQIDLSRRSGAERASLLRWGWEASALPRWPFALPFVGYPVAWLLGIGDLIWPLAALVMLGFLLRSRDVCVPRGSLTWFAFLMWVACSMVAIDTFGRVIGAGYRLALYMAAAIMAMYVYNSWKTLTLRFVTGVMTVFLGIMTAGGCIAMLFPRLTFVTPLYFLVPGSLRSNELINEMIIRRVTQWTANTWIPQDPRPSAPFVYTNTWGNVYSLVLPLAVLYLVQVWHTRRRLPVLLLILASLIPAASTLNRGMYIGLGIVAIWYLIQAFRRGAFREVAIVLFVSAAGVVAVLLSSLGDRLVTRVATTSSTEDRAELYLTTLMETLQSPIFGYGAPRPAAAPWLPSLGTQGQFWTVLFSHGVIGAVLFIGFLASRWVRSIRRTDVAGAVLGGLILATLVETAYYGMMTGIAFTFVAIALAERPDTRILRHPQNEPRLVGVSKPGSSGRSGRTQPIGQRSAQV